ncbi:hypothetical protein AGMMS50268_16300 [Spirochaetia bacterium]|nr:hypothetical protein AGMMS50268_16300 [Spirochaetia bacterium]
MDSKKIYISISLGNNEVSVGTLWSYYRNGRETASFEYAPGWLSSPERFALEMGPHVLSTAIDFTSREASLDTALSVIADFRLSPKEAGTIIQTVTGAVKPWKSIARSFGLSRAEIERMETAFRV